VAVLALVFAAGAEAGAAAGVGAGAAGSAAAVGFFVGAATASAYQSFTLPQRCGLEKSQFHPCEYGKAFRQATVSNPRMP
jgi:hypothetical protein